MATCIKCKTELPEGAKFCPACGKKQQADRRKRKKRANGTGSISKLSGKRNKPYVARINNIQIGTFSTAQEAEKALNRLTDRIVEESFNMTFAQVYEAWKPTHAALLRSRAIERGSEDGRTSGMEGYASAYKNCAILHDRVFRTLRKADLQAVVDDLRDCGKSKAVADKVKQLYGQLYKWAISENIVLVNLAQSVVVVSEHRKPKPTFTDSEIRKLEASDIPAADVALILLGTGGRINELFSAKTENCFDSYFISGSKSEAGTGRVIPVSPVGIASYQKLLIKARKEHLARLIDAYGGNRNSGNYRKRDYYPMLEKLGIGKKPPHCSRHTYTTNAVRAGVRPEELTKILGHADYATTIKNYDHPDIDTLVAAAQKVK